MYFSPAYACTSRTETLKNNIFAVATRSQAEFVPRFQSRAFRQCESGAEFAHKSSHSLIDLWCSDNKNIFVKFQYLIALPTYQSCKIKYNYMKLLIIPYISVAPNKVTFTPFCTQFVWAVQTGNEEKETALGTTSSVLKSTEVWQIWTFVDFPKTVSVYDTLITYRCKQNIFS